MSRSSGRALKQKYLETLLTAMAMGAATYRPWENQWSTNQNNLVEYNS